MANGNIIRSQDVDWSDGTSWSSTRFLRGDGTWADPIGILPAYSNVVFIAKNGDDTTALAAFTAASNKGVLAYPFLTIAAARSAVSGAGTASATNRWLGKIMGGGTWTEQLVLLSYMDWDLGNAIIDLQAGAAYTIDDNNVACDSIIYGNAQILRSTAGTLGCIRTQNTSTNIRIECDKINTSRGHGVQCVGRAYIRTKNGITTTFSTGTPIGVESGTALAEIIIVGDITASGTGGRGVAGGNIRVYGNIIGASTGIVLGTGTQIIHGNVTSTASIAAECDGGSQTIYGNVTSTSNAGALCWDSLTSGTSVQTIYGNCSGTVGASLDLASTQTIKGDCTGTTSFGASCIDGTQNIKGRIVTTASNTDAYSVTAGTAILDGCTLIATGTGKSIADGSTVLIYGDCVGNKPLGTAITKVGNLIISSEVV